MTDSAGTTSAGSTAAGTAAVEVRAAAMTFNAGRPNEVVALSPIDLTVASYLP